jgi:hypothetical protein
MALGTQQTNILDEMLNDREAEIRNLMSQGYSREEAEDMLGPLPEGGILAQSEVFTDDYTGEYDSNVEDPASPVIEETSTTKLEDGTTITQSIKNPNNSPKGIAKEQSTEESNPTDSQDGPLDEDLLNAYGLGSRGVDKDIGILDWEGWGDYDRIDQIESAGPTGTIANALQDPQGTLGLWDEDLTDPLNETQEFINRVTGADNTPEVGYSEPKIPETADEAIGVLAKDGKYEFGVVNNFAQWADKNTDDAAVEKATEIMKKAKESGIDRIKPHVYKALGIALASMLFGADAATAANQGLGAVAASFERSRQNDAASAAAIAAREKFMFEERFKTEEEIKVEMAKAALDTPGNEQARLKEIRKNNQDMITTLAADINRSLTEDEKEKWGVRSIRGEVARAVAKMESTYKGYDLTKSINQGIFSDAIEKWITSPGRSKTPLFTFIEDQIARNKLTGESGFAAEDFVKGSVMTDEEYHTANKTIFEKMKRVAGRELSDGIPAGENGAGRLMREAYESFKTNNTDAFKEMSRKAKAAGMTPMMYFLARKYTP